MKYSIFLCTAAFLLTASAFAQGKKENAAALQAAVIQKTYVFHAQTALPASGRSRQLTSEYSFRVNKDSIFSDLPYFGRAYSAPLDATRSVLYFRSGQFDHTVLARKKGGWNINIKFKDVREVQSVFISISPDGFGTLQVQPTNRQTISFNGNVDEK